MGTDSRCLLPVAKNRILLASPRLVSSLLHPAEQIIHNRPPNRQRLAILRRLFDRAKGLCPVPDSLSLWSLLITSNRTNPLGPAHVRHGRQDWLANARATASAMSASPAKPRDLIRPPLGRFTFEPFSIAPGLAAPWCSSCALCDRWPHISASLGVEANLTGVTGRAIVPWPMAHGSTCRVSSVAWIPSPPPTRRCTDSMGPDAVPG